MAEERFFELNDDVGIDADGNPEPIVVIGLTVSVPTMKGGEIVDIEHRVDVKPVKPGSRIVATDDPSVAGALLSHGGLHEIDPPTAAKASKSAASTKDAREGAANSETEE